MPPTPTDLPAYLLPLLQFADSALPTGAFSHSFGLESYVAEGVVHDRDGVAAERLVGEDVDLGEAVLAHGSHRCTDSIPRAIADAGAAATSRSRSAPATPPAWARRPSARAWAAIFCARGRRTAS